MSKWVDDNFFARIQNIYRDSYNQHRERCREYIKHHGATIHEGGRIWYSGPINPDGSVQEFDEELFPPIKDLSGSSPLRHDTSTSADYSYSCPRVFEHPKVLLVLVNTRGNKYSRIPVGTHESLASLYIVFRNQFKQVFSAEITKFGM